jgi:hypothetical protein
MLRRFLRLIGIIWQALGAGALILVLVFLAIKIPIERREARVEREQVNHADGPHVFRLDDSRVKVLTLGFERARQRFVPQEQVRPRQPGEFDSAPEPAVFDAKKVAAVSDLHGQYNHFIRLLQNARVIDRRLQWTWGPNHLVVAGDVFGKGPSVTECLWLIKRLEVAAAENGGGVHFLLGNHDHLTLRGDSVARKYADVAAQFHLNFRQLFAPDTVLGHWLRQKNVVVKIGHRLFLHGGISETVLDRRLSIEEVNRLGRLYIDPNGLLNAPQSDREAADEAFGRNGILWSKAYFEISTVRGFVGAFRGHLYESEAGRTALERALTFYGCRQIVVGHSYTRTIAPLYGRRLIAIDVIKGGNDIVDQDSTAEMLLIEDERLYRIGLRGAPQPL